MLCVPQSEICCHGTDACTSLTDYHHMTMLDLPENAGGLDLDSRHG